MTVTNERFLHNHTEGWANGARHIADAAYRLAESVDQRRLADRLAEIAADSIAEGMAEDEADRRAGCL